MPQIDLASWSSPARALWPSGAQERGLSIATTAGRLRHDDVNDLPARQVTLERQNPAIIDDRHVKTFPLSAHINANPHSHASKHARPLVPLALWLSTQAQTDPRLPSAWPASQPNARAGEVSGQYPAPAGTNSGLWSHKMRRARQGRSARSAARLGGLPLAAPRRCGELDGMKLYPYHFGMPAESQDPPSQTHRSADMARQRLMLDTNIWSRLAEQGQGYQFNQLVRNKQLDIVMPPATLLEILRTRDRKLRRAATKLVCRRAWQRLRTEAQAEAAELTTEIRRLRPAWILDQPDFDTTARLERFWRRIIYDLALAGAPELVELNQVVGARERKEISDLQRDQQARFRSDGFFRSIEEAKKQFPTLVITPGPPGAPTSRGAEAAGWVPGTKVAPWRLALLSIQWRALILDPVRTHITGQAATYADWVGPYVNLDAIRYSRRDFGHLILYETEEANMPRTWLRQAVALMQHSMRLGRGNPVDAQLASYLVDADLFITNDKRYAQILEAARPSAKTPYATSLYVDIHRAAGDAVAAIAEVI